jgi:sarcosine oxidase subunit gamma
MADSAALRRPPLVTETAEISALPPATRFILRGDASVIAAAGGAIGIDVDQTPCRASRAGARALLWLGPDEWLLVAPEAEVDTLQVALEQALSGRPHALVDVSHRQTGLAIQGVHAADILNSACPLDLDQAAFPVGMCTRTAFAKAEIVLWRTASDAFQIEVWRSFADYVARLLAEAGREY